MAAVSGQEQMTQIVAIILWQETTQQEALAAHELGGKNTPFAACINFKQKKRDSIEKFSFALTF